MPPKDPPPVPAAWKILALLAWFLLLALMIALDKVTGQMALIAGGTPLGVVLGFRVSDFFLKR